MTLIGPRPQLESDYKNHYDSLTEDVDKDIEKEYRLIERKNL